MKVAVGGFQHETNVFAPYKADYAAFEQRDEWPPLSLGAQMLDNVRGVHLPISGAIARLRELGHEIAPLLWCSAVPCAHVRESAFERIAAMLFEALRNALPVDGVLLDLHGAMVCEHLPDGDGELLRRARAVAAGVPVVASLDLHANLSNMMAEKASALDIYRTYPHVDMGDTGARAADQLDALMRHRLTRFPAAAMRRADFLIPLNWGCTLLDPAKSIYDFLARRAGKVAGLSLACGFPHSDVPEAVPALITYGFEQRAVVTAADDLLRELQRRELEFRGKVYGIEDGVTEALRLAVDARGPVLLADTQDNPGGGGPGDATEILRALVAHHAAGALVGLINDAQAAKRAHAAGRDAEIDIALGGTSGVKDSRPFEAKFRVLNLSDGQFQATGPMLAGARIDLGPVALLETGGVRVVVASKAVQAMDQSMFRHLQIDPAAAPIIALKSSVHFRNDFQQMAAAILIIAAPGPVTADLADVPFQTPSLQQLGKLAS
ncbi:MAG: M81 family metallopeptidase [Gammaproteobacteria bacterium]